MTKTTLSDIASSPEQQAGALWTRAYNCIANTPKKMLEKRTFDKHFYLVSPTVSYAHGMHTAAVAMLTYNGTRPTYDIDEGRPLYLIIDGNFVNPRIQFGKFETSKAVYDPTDATEAEIDTTDVESVISMIERELEYHKEEETRRWSQRRRSVRSLFRRFRWPLIALAVILFVTAAVFGGCSIMNSHDAADRQRDADYAVKYDTQNLTVKGEAIMPGHAAILANDPDIMVSNPPSASLDAVSHKPRKLGITADSCIPAGRINTTGEHLVAASDGPTANVVAFVSADGNVHVCAITNAYKRTDSSKNSEAPSYTVVVQAQDNK